MKELILASASPRRKQLLEMVGYPFTVAVSDAAEETDKTQPGEIVMDLSYQKARAVAAQTDLKPGTLILGADTIVVQDGEVLGKPLDEADAARMIRMLAGRSHSVFTGVTLLEAGDGPAGEPFLVRSRFFRETVVFVHAMSEEEIHAYLLTGEAYDKAGAYGIQGAFGVYVDRIEGDYNNVVGLPVSAVYQALRETGIFARDSGEQEK